MSTQQKLPPVTSPEQAAAVLGVSMTADVQAIHQAYRAAARRAHPDVGGTAERFAHIRSAYELLLWQRRPEASSTAAVVVRPGAAVWVRARLRGTTVAIAVVQAAGLITAALTWGTPALTWLAVGLALVLVTTALWSSTGRPPVSVGYWRQRWVDRRSRRQFEEWDTQPIPVMTDERIRQYEQTGW